VVSAHWESDELLIGSSPQPTTWHDFGGFPAPLYAVQYPAPGAPEIALEVQRLLAAADLPARLDDQRPRDHGAWVPLSLLYPQADVPVLQLSLPSHAGPALQVRIGEALAPLRAQGVLLIGSGSITHNLGELDWRAGPEAIEPWAGQFRDWMVARLQADDRLALLDYRRQAPHARRNHPSDEHLLPLYFALGAGGTFKVEHSGFTYGALGMDIYSFT
jgi:4,5-DOPA dioxygenase extradiol